VPAHPSAGHAALLTGVFAIAAATLMYEILLTRIFSVTMWYHFAFLAVAAALLGMTAGAVLVHARPRSFTLEATPARLAWSAAAFAIGVPATFLLHLAVPVVPALSPLGLLSVVLTYAIITVPFVFSGIAICLALTRSGGPVGSIYAADLAGAALGCVATVGVLKVADAPVAVLAVGALAGAGATLLAARAARPRVVLLALLATGVALAGFATRPSWLRPVWVKGATETRPTLYERWNSYSRVRVAGDPDATARPFGWGLSPAYPRESGVSQLLLSIDAIADTVLTRFDGDLAAVEHLRWDVTNLAHYLRPRARVLVIGAGGGRDILAALVFGQREIVGVEVNEAVLAAVNGHFGSYTGHLDRQPSVRFVNDEARSYVARLDRRFDIIQVSFIDTFAATAAGAYVLTEHSLYTVEAWQTFLDRLAPGGILTVSRWHFHRLPAEIQRLVALATGTLLRAGVPRPRDHLLLIRSRTGADPRYAGTVGVGTLLVGRDPFSPADVAAVRQLAGRLGFEVALEPGGGADPGLAALTDARTLDDAIAASPLDISPPTDDRPFFFHTVPLGRALRLALVDQANVSFNVAAIVVLVGALAVVGGLIAAALLVTVARRRRAGASLAPASHVLFFAAIGLGYILIEMALLHRLTVFLGHPTYGLVVVLFALLLSSGAGSLAVRRLPATNASWGPLAPVLALPVVLAVLGLLALPVTAAARGLETPLRIAVATGLLAPMGFVMGTAFPRGLQLVTRARPASGPWLWAINGAASVLGSLAAVVVSISAGVSATFWCGVAAYLLAAGAALRLAR
jgi:hypothetical protein